VLDKRGEAPIDAQFKGIVGLEPRQRGRATLRHPIDAEESRAGQGLGEALGEAGLAAPQRPNDVVERENLGELEALATPRPGKREADAQLGSRLAPERQRRKGWRFALGERRPERADSLEGFGEPPNLAFEPRLLRQ